MWPRQSLSRFDFIVLSTLIVAVPFTATRAFSQEEAAAGAVVEKSARERDLRDQLQNSSSNRQPVARWSRRFNRRWRRNHRQKRRPNRSRNMNWPT